MSNKYRHLGVSLTTHEMKDVKGGATAPPPNPTRWECHNDPTDWSWVDYICYNGAPPCPYPCFPAGACQPGDYNGCVM